MSEVLSISLPVNYLDGLKKYYEAELGKPLTLKQAEKHAREDAKLFLIERAKEGEELPDQ